MTPVLEPQGDGSPLSADGQHASRSGADRVASSDTSARAAAMMELQRSQGNAFFVRRLVSADAGARAALVLGLQRSHGNAAVQRLVARGSPAATRLLQRTLVKTGAGKVASPHPSASKYPVGALVSALLSNFDVDGAALKPEHRDFLDREIVPRVAHKNARVLLQGEASHSGEDDYNLKLSRRRVDATVRYLMSAGVWETQIGTDAVGESEATKGVNEADSDRAVSLIVLPIASTPAVKLPPLPKPGPPKSTTFKIRLLGALSGGGGVIPGLLLERLWFQVWDYTHSLSCIYQYEGKGLGKGFGPSISTTTKGPWNEFETTEELQCTDFAGDAQFHSIGTWRLTANYLYMEGMPAGIKTVPSSLPIDTGPTFGVGASTTAGKLIPSNRVPEPFKGP